MFQNELPNSTPIVNRILSTAAATMIFAGVFASVTAVADDRMSGHVPTVTVEYGDLDLTRTAGIATLDARLATAAKRVCRELDRNGAEARSAWKRCYSSAFANAKSQMDRSAFAAR